MKNGDIKMTIRYYPQNAKKHPDKQIDQIAASLERFGWQQPIKVGEDGYIIVGHGRYLAYEKYPDKIKEPWVINEQGETISGGPETRKLTKEEEKAYRLADNKLNESEWDMDLVTPELESLDLELQKLTGFDIFRLEEIGQGTEFQLPNGDREPFRQMTFTLADEQADKVEIALKTAKALGEIETYDNENSNGNALYRIVKEWLEAQRI